MKIKRNWAGRKNKYLAALVSLGLVFVVLFNTIMPANAQLNKKYTYTDTNYSVPTANVAWVSPSGSDTSGNGSENSPYATFKKALSAVSSGGTVVAKTGIYREPHFVVDKNGITIQAAPHAEVWLKGSDVVTNWTRSSNGWQTTGDYHNFCHVCTTNADPAKEGVAAYPEQVFINDKPLRQVATKVEVKPGSDTFYVEDSTPTTLKVAGDNTKGYNIGAQDRITYYIGQDPTAGTTEISERSRALTVTGENFAMKGINVAQYSPVQAWGFNDPTFGPHFSGPTAVAIVGKKSLIENSIITQSADTGVHFGSSESSIVRNSKIIDNGGTGLGLNRAHSTVITNNEFGGNNKAGFLTADCGAYCTIADIKAAHVKNLTFRDNVVDNSTDQTPYSSPANANRGGIAGFWCDEGCIETKVTNNFFTNLPVAIHYEVSGSGVIASNIIESSGEGIRISSSEKVKVYNNTISRTYRPIFLFEDQRVDGCNAWSGGSCVSPERWSIEQGLSWNMSNVELYNNIISSRPFVETADLTGDAYWRSYSLRLQGSSNHNGKPYTDANDMLKGLDYNAYYRNDSKDVNLAVWDFKSLPGKLDTVFGHVSDITKDSRISGNIDGKEAKSFDSFGSRANNPYFTKEADGNADYKKSNYNLKAGSLALGSGRPLPADVALAIDPSGSRVKAGVAVNRGALSNVLMDATNGQAQNPSTPPASDKVAIPDANLKAALNKTIAAESHTTRTDSQDITEAELKSLKSLNLSANSTTPENNKITDLTGLEAATNLTHLGLDAQNVSNLAPIAGLTKLTSLTLPNNKVSSLDAVSQLTHLTTLNVSGNPLQSFAPIAHLPKLETISLSSSATNLPLDIAMFNNSKNSLVSLKFYNYNNDKVVVNNITALQSMPKLKALRLSGTSLAHKDVQTIGRLTNLTSLRLDQSTIADISPLAQLTNLTELKLEGQRAAVSTTNSSLVSPIKNVAGDPVPVIPNASVAYQGQNINIINPLYDGKPHTVATKWSMTVGIGSANSEFSGDLSISYTLQPADDPALQQEKEAEAKAKAAVDKAQSSKSPVDVRAARLLLDNVKNAAKKSEFQTILNAIDQEISHARSTLIALIDKVKKTQLDGMIDASTAALRSKLSDAELIVANQNASVGQLVQATVQLQGALDGVQTDKSALQKAMSDAEKELPYIKNDSTVQQALQSARTIHSKANPSPSEVRTAVQTLRAAIDKAKKQEAETQRAAMEAIVKAESQKTKEAKASAQALIAKVQDPQQKALLQQRLDKVVVAPTNPPVPPVSPKNTATIPQADGTGVVAKTAGDTCYNITNLNPGAAPKPQKRYRSRETIAFKIDCGGHASPQVGYSTTVVLELTRHYKDQRHLRVFKYGSGNTLDITSKVAFGVTADGKRTTLTYTLTDGGFGDQDGVANGVIEDPVAVYEQENSAQPGTGRNGSGVANSGAANLAETGQPVYFYGIGVVVVAVVGGIVIRRMALPRG